MFCRNEGSLLNSDIHSQLAVPSTFLDVNSIQSFPISGVTYFNLLPFPVRSLPSPGFANMIKLGLRKTLSTPSRSLFIVKIPAQPRA